MRDGFGREHTDLRLSITDHCNFRCFYCMKQDQRFVPMRLELDTDEIVRVARIAHRLGVRSLRLTGGEPLMRADAVEVVRRLAGIGFEDLSMTTNASLLCRVYDGTTLARALRDAGLQRLNISCDSLDPERFARIRRRGDLTAVMAGLREAQRVGFAPIKMNVVVIRGSNDDEVVELARFARETHREGHPVIVRFIEFMPMGETGENQANWSPEKVVSAHEILTAIRSRWPLTLASQQGDHAPAARWRFSDGIGEIGVIPTMTNPFCADCNRLRVTADGFVMRCLFSAKDQQFSLRNLLRRDGGASDDELAEVFTAAVRSKRAGQDRDAPTIFTDPGDYLSGSRAASGVTMSQIGG